jgi:excisionase family DNA binding protein
MATSEKALALKRLLYSKRDAAEMLSISVRSLDYLIVTRQLPARRIGRRVLIHHDAIHQFAKHDRESIRPLAITSER